MFAVHDSDLELESLKKKLANSASGGFVSFEGWVRDHNEGRSVSSLEYQVYHELALKEGERILQEAKEKFAINEMACVHREGHLQIGDLAVWVGVSAAHRGAAFEACRYIIDEVKKRLPIWKKEHYVDGPAVWVDCQACKGHHFKKTEYYLGQKNLQGFEQDKLEKKVLVIGAGGLGCPALTQLASAGVKEIGIVDFDEVELSNLHRQSLYSTDDIGKKKVHIAKARLEKLNPFVKIRAFDFYFDLSKIGLVDDYDLVLDCSDNLRTKFLLNDACFLKGKPLIQAAVTGWQGQLQSFHGHGCLRCLWPEMPENDCVESCAEAGILGAVPGLLGTYQALEALRYLQGEELASYEKTILYDLKNLQQSEIARKVDSDCPLCGESSRIKILDETLYKNEIEISELEKGMELVDVRGLNQEELLRLNEKKKYLLYCDRGIRSLKIARELRNTGRANFYSLLGGEKTLEQL